MQLLYSLRRSTEKAARAAFDWIGRGDKNRGDDAAVSAMRESLNTLDVDGTVVIGEGEKDNAPQLYNGERCGNRGSKNKIDIAVDPVEGTSYLAKGLTNALAVIVISPKGSMLDPSPAYYMEKFAAPPDAYGKIDPTWDVKKKLKELAGLLKKNIKDITVFILEKPRHKNLVEAIYNAGAKVALYPAGDVAGAIMASIPGSGIDALMGTGGTPEGIISACAIRAMGGEFLARLDPQLLTERMAVKNANLSTARWYQRDELIKSDDINFCATGITTGLLVEGVSKKDNIYRTQTLMIAGSTKERQILINYSL